MPSNVQPQWRGLLYNLKRNYGDKVYVYTRKSATFDASTGERTLDATRWVFEYGIAMSAKIALTELQGIYVNKQNPRLSKGGGYDTDTRVFVLDRRDNPTMVIQKEDWIEYAGVKYSVDIVEDYPIAACSVITAQAIVGEPLTSLTFTDSASVSPHATIEATNDD